MRFSVLLLGVGVGPVSLSPAVADDADTCVYGTGDEEIAACTRLINSGRFKDHNLAVLNNNRGKAYHAKGDNDRAVADFNEAIRLDPKFAIAYFNRGLAYSVKGDDIVDKRSVERGFADTAAGCCAARRLVIDAIHFHRRTASCSLHGELPRGVPKTSHDRRQRTVPSAGRRSSFSGRFLDDRSVIAEFPLLLQSVHPHCGRETS
jgi:tetratricopeptide (TPR) repeat protein